MCAYLLINHYINKPGFIRVPAPTPQKKSQIHFLTSGFK